MQKIITAKGYQLLSEEDKINYRPHEWSSYKIKIKENRCYECGHVEKEKSKVPANKAKPISYIELTHNQKLWINSTKDYIENYNKALGLINHNLK